MKVLFYVLTTLVFLAGCKTSRDFLSRSDNDNTLFEAVKALRKNSSDTGALRAIPVLYNQAKERNLRKINSYSSSPELSRWDKIIGCYQTLQQMHDAIMENDAASRLVTPDNYSQNLYSIKQQAAGDYYDAATRSLTKPTRNDAKTAWTFFKKADALVPGYRDATVKMEEALELGTVKVVINPVQDNSYFYNSGWGNFGYSYSNEYFQQTLVRELSNLNQSRCPARFYTDWEIRRDNIVPDWQVNLTLRNMDIPRPVTNTYNRNVSRQIEAGRDTSGKVIYQTVYATVRVARQSFTARADMEININELATRRNIVFNTYREEYRWEEEHATYSGDSRALGPNDWAIINNSFGNEPRREDVLNELYRKLYPQVKNRIMYTVQW